MKHVIILAVIFAVAFLLVRNKVASNPYVYDEADYMFAASLGMVHNWTDAGTMPIGEFVRVGTRRGSDPTQRGALSTLARASPDPVVYRHWHGPLYYYWLAIVSKLVANEHAMHALSFLFPALIALVMYFGSLLTIGGVEGQVAAVLSSALFLWSPVTLETSEVAPHMLFVLCCVSELILLAKAAAGGGRAWYYAAGICAGLAFSTMEVAFVPILVLMIFGWWHREPLGAGWRLARNTAACFLATVLVAWPMGLLRLNFVKAYLVMVYLAAFREGAWGDVTLGQTWLFRFLISPVEWCLFLVALFLLFLPARRTRAGALTFLLFAALMILATWRVYSEVPRYMALFFGVIEMFTAWMLAPVLARLARPFLLYGTVAAICGVLIWNSHRRMSHFMLREDPRPAAAYNALRANGMQEKPVLAPREEIPALHYYFPRMQVQGYSAVTEIPSQQSARHFDAVLYPDYSLKIGPP